ncbi:hypothetical protein [Streptomyces sp. CBMA29]|uniref:hypothetical protein n=1 Tax=Streptomyces sp. CBMA29 TaxID=1896314 RepID=UPI001661A215|nr:hypothetical protein [Streptomyces sp. CBMA29]MBD0734974.1 hypothetical protein [Streptomyces sp. CBMA29]
MGGDGWSRAGAYQPDLAAAFRAEQERELSEDDHGFGTMTMAERWADPDWQEYIMTGGTASVLDQIEVVASDNGEEGPFMRPLTDAEIRAWCPGGRPTEAEWNAALSDSGDLYPDRAAGNCTVLYDADGTPASIGYWGVTAD